MSQRKQLPTRRGGYNQKLKVGGQTVYLRTGEYEDGTLGEIFLDVSRTGTVARALFGALAIVVSRALQYGVPLQEFVKSFKDFNFQPNGEVEGDPRILSATSILDCVFRELELTYLLNNIPEPKKEEL